MTDVIDLYFSILLSLWTVIVQNWILSAFVLIAIISWIVNLVVNARAAK